MIARAVICPSTPLLARELSGREPVLPELRDACLAAVQWLLEPRPETVIVVGPGQETTSYDPDDRLDVTVFAPVGAPAGAPAGARATGMPAAVGLGAMLLDEAGWDGPRVLRSAGGDETPAGCAALGRSLAERDAVMLVMGDGSARRSAAAPGHFDERAAGFDADVERALRDGDLDALRSLDAGLARDLMVTGRPAWQVLAGALGPAGPGDLLYADDPFGVFYLVATINATARVPGA